MNINDIARLAGVSKSTVSRVLNNNANVNKDMKERVLKVIKETGYRPNALAKELVMKKTHLIGVIIPRIDSTVFADMVDGITNYLTSYGYNIILQFSKADESIELSQFEFLQKKQVDGIIFFPGNMTEKITNTINQIKIPIVIIGLDSLNINRSVVLYDEKASVVAMVNYFLEINRKNIAFIGIDYTLSPVGAERKIGYLQALNTNNITINKDYIYEGSFEIETGYLGIEKIINESKTIPNAIFAATDYIAIGAITYLREHNIRVPEDIVVAGYDDLELSTYLNPSLTSIYFDYKHSGEIAAKYILATIDDPQKIQRHTVGFSIKHRSSTDHYQED